MTLEPDLEAVARSLGHDFRAPELLLDALTHRSFRNERPDLAPRDNERLEFLGDAVLSASASALLFERFPAASEGELTRRRADLVCEAGLAQLARELGLGSAMRLGKGEDRSGGRDKPRLLCSCLEACFAAVFLDAGAEAASAVVRRLLEPRLSEEALGARDYKTRVQELAQGRKLGVPRYQVTEVHGPDHARRYRVACCLDGAQLGEGEGRSKLEAEQEAACVALRSLEGTDG